MVQARDVLIYLSLIYSGEWVPIYDFISSKKHVETEVIEQTIAKANVQCLTYIDDEFPHGFHECFRPPFALFYEGNISLLTDPNKKIISVGGSLDIDADTTRTIKEVIDEVCEQENVAILSTLARGSQMAATKAAIEKGKCILMLPSGIDRPFNAAESELIRLAKQKALVISQYPPGTEATPERTRVRNLYVAQAGDFFFVTSCRLREPVYEMVAIALQRGRDIGCLPYRAREGNHNNSILKDGAFLITSGEDILFNLGLSNQPFPDN